MRPDPVPLGAVQTDADERVTVGLLHLARPKRSAVVLSAEVYDGICGWQRVKAPGPITIPQTRLTELIGLLTLALPEKEG